MLLCEYASIICCFVNGVVSGRKLSAIKGEGQFPEMINWCNSKMAGYQVCISVCISVFISVRQLSHRQLLSHGQDIHIC